MTFAQMARQSVQVALNSTELSAQLARQSVQAAVQSEELSVQMARQSVQVFANLGISHWGTLLPPFSIDPVPVGSACTAWDGAQLSVLAINFPAGLQIGDGLIAFVHCYNVGTTDPVLPGNGWTILERGLTTNWGNERTVWYTTYDGSQSGNATFANAVNIQVSMHAYRNVVDFATTPPEAAVINGSGLNTDPPQLTPSWGGSSDSMYLAAAMRQGTGSFSVNAPTGYTNTCEMNAGGSAGIHTATAVRGPTSDSPEDPSTFSTVGGSSTFHWDAFTVALKAS